MHDHALRLHTVHLLVLLRAKGLMEATAGSLVGVGEIVLLPCDVLKIKAQTNPQVHSLPLLTPPSLTRCLCEGAQGPRRR